MSLALAGVWRGTAALSLALDGDPRARDWLARTLGAHDAVASLAAMRAKALTPDFQVFDRRGEPGSAETSED